MHHGRELKEKAKKKKKRKEVIIEIPNDDVLEEIMVIRLPAKTLTRFQIVSKHWRHVYDKV
ncbi:hypothetical protein ARALYDRAFT_904681 [Arabidopsis lyrata subsp. lyrata]|uniref:F-box domain-containing protein n=1 Tax=Arabidopsis lyrata subsp. lyrata TaxID=81972 RepID=D7LQN0_ARALL|nr:hypothetical protein ARALYDRAFT_904681 [Arabidopsis lyrata subsp. lyrata]